MITIFSLIKIIKMFNSFKLMNLYLDFPFECGISSNYSMRKSYSLPLFFLSLIFLMFDMEIILMLPFIFLFLSIPSFKFLILNIIILLISLFMEWYFGSFFWMKN
uniref:NADH-ubiquinone oxidoreductase chain 3 n=1 Tax=Liposcelis paeta TaxID=209927 RepID=A0A096X725_9NEOP|nr:NADH dehydrogenase subunit 3 [Liposcelis paeta]